MPHDTEDRDARLQRGEFLAMVGHELRNPLAPLKAAIYLLRRVAHDDERVAELAGVMERQITHLSSLVDDFLEAGRVGSGQPSLDRSVRSVSDILGYGAETVESMVALRKQRLSVEMPEEPLWLRVDYTKMCQLVANLLNNASKFTPVGGEIVVTARANGDDELEISVRDNGKGIPPDMLESVFERCWQAERSPDGLGLGLWIARSIAELHGGQLRAESDGPGTGTRMILRLPRSSPERPAAWQCFVENDAEPDPPGATGCAPRSGQREPPLCCDQ